ncbi:MAG: mechanosensitive ion channel [Wenzhouxiangellaceae bacterium]
MRAVVLLSSEYSPHGKSLMLDTIWEWLKTQFDRLLSVFSHPLFKISGTDVTAGGIIWLILTIIIGFVVSSVLRRLLNGYINRKQTRPGEFAALYTLGRVLHYVIMSVALFVGLSTIGIDFTKLALIAGGLGIGIGLGLQNVVNNFVSGLVILFDRSVKVGDFLQLEAGVSGRVKEINTRFTRITTNDNIDILVPNSQLISDRLVNWTLRENMTRMHVPFGVAYGSDKEVVKKAALEAADSVPYTLKHRPGRDPEVWLVNFGDSSLDFELLIWLTPDGVHSPARVKAAYMWALETALRKYEVEIPFPQRDLHLRSGFQRPVGSEPEEDKATRDQVETDEQPNPASKPS